MTTKKNAVRTTRPEPEEDDGPRVKISITVPPEVLERIDTYRKRRGGLNRSALFSLAADWFMDEHPLKRD
ncbi:ribbon-helix-helix protein, CopG family [Paraburkholderia silvatlantica]|uniref:ribbon-helix-helix protein, CopG family n=1 Tax=Paraburkholderia silvatlantica TaxID=321895 RepID=UPI003751231E